MRDSLKRGLKDGIARSLPVHLADFSSPIRRPSSFIFAQIFFMSSQTSFFLFGSRRRYAGWKVGM